MPSTDIISSAPLKAGRRRRIGLVPLVAAALVVGLLGACVDIDRGNALDAVRGDRARNGVRTVAVDGSAQAKAQAHAETLARSGALYHSNLRLGRGECSKGENVGMGGSIGEIEGLFMQSSRHRNNILNRSFDHVGIGVARANGRVWVVQVFVDRC